MNRGAGPVGLGLTWIGAALMVVSTFLPLVEPTGFFRFVQQNSLIQHNGWLLILVAIAIASGGFRARDGREWYWSFGAAVAAVLGIVYWATNTGLRTLYSVGADGQADTSQGGMVGSWGIAIYVAGVGAALAVIGSLMLRQGGGTSAGRKKCPDCAEVVLVDAQVCKHCATASMRPVLRRSRRRRPMPIPFCVTSAVTTAARCKRNPAVSR